jgi:hypothetical protein
MGTEDLVIRLEIRVRAGPQRRSRCFCYGARVEDEANNWDPLAELTSDRVTACQKNMSGGTHPAVDPICSWASTVQARAGPLWLGREWEK